MPYRKIGLALVFVWFIAGGVGHFAAPQSFVEETLLGLRLVAQVALLACIGWSTLAQPPARRTLGAATR